MNNVPKIQSAEDEEDLEALRMAALQSLKKKDGSADIVGQQFGQNLIFENFRPMKGMRNKKGRFFSPHSGRGGKNCHFNNRSRNTNLISIPTVSSETAVVENQPAKGQTSVTLLGNQCYNTLDKEISKEDGTSKFSRYNNSDKSESESEMEEETISDNDNPGKLERSNSLDALMEELDNEIQGKIKEEKEKSKVKRIKKKKQKTSESDSAVKSDADDKAKESEGENKTIEPPSEIAADNVDSAKLPDEVTISGSESRLHQKDFTRMPFRKRHRSRSPPNRRFYNRHRQRMNNFNDIPNNPPHHMLFEQAVPFQPQILPFPNQPFMPFGPPMINIPNQIPPPFYERPLSPLAINTESLTTATMAPLSPRSAAFVLENKAIIEKRKRSPRRSYSRSLSRSPPRRSPRRSISPRRLSRSPRRLSPRRRSLSPRRMSLSPRRRSISPKRRKIVRPPENNQKNKAPVRERLGGKSAKTDENKDKPLDKPKERETTPKKDEKPLDPVLEARRKKFESNEIKKKEGIIRLKPKEDAVPTTSTEIVSSNKENQTPVAITTSAMSITSSATVTSSTTITSSATVTSSSSSKDVAVQAKESEKPVVAEPDQSKVPDEFDELEKLLNDNPFDDVLNAKVDDIFSDEDSDSDNEGRFKIKGKAASSEKLTVIPFAKLASDTKRDIKVEPLLGSNRRTPRRRSRHDQVRYERDRRRPRGRTPPENSKKEPSKEDVKKNEIKKVEAQEKPTLKHRITLRSERYTPPIDKRFERKIEIKIKNPSKYERSSKPKDIDDEVKIVEQPDRKIKEEDKDVEAIEDEIEPEIIIENDSADEEKSNTDEGDLRAQLSKKRAEKLHKIPVEEVSSRLLQYALQGAVFKKSKKRTKEKKDISNNDGKLPIHLRLGIANHADIFPETKVKRKSRKRKNRDILEQV